MANCKIHSIHIKFKQCHTLATITLTQPPYISMQLMYVDNVGAWSIPSCVDSEFKIFLKFYYLIYSVYSQFLLKL